MIGQSMSWGEAWRLTQVLIRDTSSHVCAAVQGWDGPRSREWLLIADLFDLTHAVNSRRTPTPYPRPGDAPKRFGHTNLRNSEVFAVLRSHGHTIT